MAAYAQVLEPRILGTPASAYSSYIAIISAPHSKRFDVDSSEGATDWPLNVCLLTAAFAHTNTNCNGKASIIVPRSKHSRRRLDL